jgi:hypothetical protein
LIKNREENITMSCLSFYLILIAMIISSSQGFTGILQQKSKPTSALSLNLMSRSQVLGIAAMACAAGIAPVPALAKDDDVAKKGTKDDPLYQTCLSLCMYECTKPKGEETKLRKECLPECKQKCATTKQQLMIGTPKASE